MIQCDFRIAKSFLDDQTYKAARSETNFGYKQLVDKSGPGSEWLGWRDILASPKDVILKEIDILSSKIQRVRMRLCKGPTRQMG